MHITSMGGIYRNKSSIVNLDNAKGPSTHWMAYMKWRNRAVYFNNFGNLQPLKEPRYLDVLQIEYNRTPY